MATAATVATQRDLVVTFKKETILNVGILSKLQPMPPELSRLLFKENALEKPTQNFFNHLSYYLVSLIDKQASSLLPWPLYDTKTDKAYRNALSIFISNYSNQGLSPVMSSYLVNPGCYKVTTLIFQMSQLAVQRVLISKMNKDSQKKLYNEMTENFKSNQDGFIENIEKETVKKCSKFSNYLFKRDAMEKIAAMFRKKITDIEIKMSTLHPQKYLNEIVDGFIKTHNLDETTRSQILNIKNINKPSKFFETWLSETDEKITNMESEWNTKMNPLLKISMETQNSTEMLVARQTGEVDMSSYTLEYNPKTDDIYTKDLENQVNVEQKYVLINIIKDGKLNFPNLVRGFCVSMCFILKNTEIGNEIYIFNEYLDGGRSRYTEIVSGMRILLDRVMKAEARLQPTRKSYNQFILRRDFYKIAPMPDLTELKMGKNLQSQTIFDTYTPLNLPKHQLNLGRRATNFAKPLQSRPLLNVPSYPGQKDDFLKSLISCRSYERSNTTQNSNMSIMSQKNFKHNETIAECSSGFTKEQIMRLLSTKKSSSSKKFNYKTERPNNINIKKGGLFNESQILTDSNGLYRCHSSPNLSESKEKRSKIPIPRILRKLSVMQDDYPLLEVSGISALENDGSYGTPEGVMGLENPQKLFDAVSLPVISMTEPEKLITKIKEDSNKMNFADINLPKLQENILEKEEIKTETPKNTTHLIRKTSSLEKIINRLKKVRARVIPTDRMNEEENEFKMIVEEKDNLNTVNEEAVTANRVLLPDLLSPNSSSLPKKSMHYIDQFCLEDEPPCRKPRESLGTVLGVDHTFLDQFDLIDE